MTAIGLNQTVQSHDSSPCSIAGLPQLNLASYCDPYPHCRTRGPWAPAPLERFNGWRPVMRISRSLYPHKRHPSQRRRAQD